MLIWRYKQLLSINYKFINLTEPKPQFKIKKLLNIFQNYYIIFSWIFWSLFDQNSKFGEKFKYLESQKLIELVDSLLSIFIYFYFLLFFIFQISKFYNSLISQFPNFLII